MKTTDTCQPPDLQLTVDVVNSLSTLTAVEPDFVRMQAVTGNTVPFACYDWQVTWCRHFLGLQSDVEDSPFIHLLREVGGRCVAIVPLVRTLRRLGRFTVASLGMLGADPAITEIRVPLIEPGYEASAATALHLHLESSGGWDWIEWAGRPGVFLSTMGRLRGLGWQPSYSSHVLKLPATWETLRSGLKRNIRESLRHCYNSLERAGHRFKLRVAKEPGEVRGALDRLLELHSLRSAMAGGPVHPNRFTSSHVRGFLYEICSRFAARGVLRLFQLEIAGQIVAARIGFVVGRGLYLYYSGFDPAWARYSVMTTTVAEAIRSAIEEGLESVDLSPGSDVSKTRWGTNEIQYQIACEHSTRLRSRLAHHAYIKARSGDGVLGSVLQRLKTGRRIWR